MEKIPCVECEPCWMPVMFNRIFWDHDHWMDNAPVYSRVTV